MLYSKLAPTLFTLSAALALGVPQQQQPLTDQAPAVDSTEQYLIELSPGDTRWVTEDEKWALRREGKNFFDITAEPDYAPLRTQAKVTFPSKIAHNETVSGLFKHLDKDRMWRFMEHFTGFHTRYYKSDYGRQSSEWLLSQVNDTLSKAGVGHVKAFPHPWGQNSIIATLPGKSNKTVVVGAHQDSINLFLPSILAAPGADDDNSGTATILEALHLLLKDKTIRDGKAENTIEFHFYSAEEGGLLGSQALFQSYERQGRDVKAMLQQDMTGYTQGTIDAGKPVSVGVITDFVDAGLTKFIQKVVENYCSIPWVATKCGYACSDHASASKAGYPSAFVIESDFPDSDKKIHTSDDKIEYLDLDHMLEHAKLTVGFAYELAFAKFD
ncbi:hypothetical protein AMS68_006689 [Peltaster fructicola]|uniref:Peptide hydrolase n=1 Tax=Peltaster fructicola TaxID=286661 RepID=A0A6H0Y2C7_9PEZI|nr:hypothetical protein AMS68_006689 [Peltaster fructicola]